METKTLLVLAFCIIFVFTFIVKQFAYRFFLLITLTILGYMYYQDFEKTKRKNNNLHTHLNSVEKELEGDFETPVKDVFYIHKSPRNIKFIKKHELIRQILYDLKFLNIYDKGLYHRIFTVTEHFLKIHYKVMIGKYEFDLYYPMLVDSRHEIMNVMKSIYFNIPSISTILYIKDLDAYVEERIRKMQSITYKLLKLLCNKYKREFKPPYNFDPQKDNHYALF